MLGITMERASELVKALSGDAKKALFEHFYEVFDIGIDEPERGYMFATMCGFITVRNVERVCH